MHLQYALGVVAAAHIGQSAAQLACPADDLAVIAKYVPDTATFCQDVLADELEESPFSELSPAALISACECTLGPSFVQPKRLYARASAKKSSKTKKAKKTTKKTSTHKSKKHHKPTKTAVHKKVGAVATATTKAKACHPTNVALIKKQRPHPVRFCKRFKPKAKQVKSPIKGIHNAKAVVAACQCILRANAKGSKPNAGNKAGVGATATASAGASASASDSVTTQTVTQTDAQGNVQTLTITVTNSAAVALGTTDAAPTNVATTTDAINSVVATAAGSNGNNGGVAAAPNPTTLATVPSATTIVIPGKTYTQDGTSIVFAPATVTSLLSAVTGVTGPLGSAGKALPPLSAVLPVPAGGLPAPASPPSLPTSLPIANGASGQLPPAPIISSSPGGLLNTGLLSSPSLPGPGQPGPAPEPVGLPGSVGANGAGSAGASANAGITQAGNLVSGVGSAASSAGNAGVTQAGNLVSGVGSAVSSAGNEAGSLVGGILGDVAGTVNGALHADANFR